MDKTIEQVKNILHTAQRWNAGLQWDDFLLAIEFHQDGTGQMMYGECQGMRSLIDFRYEISVDMQLRFEFFDTTADYLGQPFERTEQNAFKTVAFQLLDGPFTIDEPFDQQHTYQHLLRFATDPFPDGYGIWDGEVDLLDYYG
ncbi:hypothetical protein [Dictyobacter formicarum]|uniref:DUF600 domain-containing protein n=1 Tax=Dictyobacter formicarum TaxID=2778368 RepID=A0ABQ3VQR4_9CHLR|nr:hypothetical protein [Dictyobacter formicarum]GHO87436.1 hypothetical protein KSZ_54420 [Dictyobacter formicarum]